jgi:hypothetical protein
MHNDVFLRCVSRRRQHRNYVCIDSPMKRWGWKRMKSGISHWRCLCLVWLLRSWTEEFGTIFTRESWWKYWVGFGFLSFTSCVWSLFSLCLVSFSSATPFRICCLQPLRSNELMFVLVKVFSWKAGVPDYNYHLLSFSTILAKHSAIYSCSHALQGNAIMHKFYFSDGVVLLLIVM